MDKKNKFKVSENQEEWMVSHLILKNQEALIKYNDFVAENRDLMFVDFDQTYYSYKKKENEKYGSRY